MLSEQETFRERIGRLARERSGDGARAAVLETTAVTRGAMPPLHAHEHDESYEIIEGEVTFFVGAEVVRATRGEVVVAPKGIARTFRVESERARWLVMTSLRSPTRYNEFAHAVAQPVGDGTAHPTWPSAEEASALQAIAAANGITVLGPPGALPT